MAEANVELQNPEMNEEGLKYLDFVQVATIQALSCFSKLYDLAKENSGPLRPGVQSVEGTVKAMVGPVYDKFHDVPYDLLKFVDHKVDTSVNKLESRVPPVVRQASNQAYTVAQKAPEVARSVADEVQRHGVSGLAKTAVAKCEPTAKELYTKYEPVAEHYAVAGWQTLNRLPLFPQVAQIIVPTAAHWSEKYNDAVCYGRENGYTVASFLLPVPTEKIAKVFGSNGGGAAAAATAAAQ